MAGAFRAGSIPAPPYVLVTVMSTFLKIKFLKEHITMRCLEGMEFNTRTNKRVKFEFVGNNYDGYADAIYTLDGKLQWNGVRRLYESSTMREYYDKGMHKVLRRSDIHVCYKDDLYNLHARSSTYEMIETIVIPKGLLADLQASWPDRKAARVPPKVEGLHRFYIGAEFVGYLGDMVDPSGAENHYRISNKYENGFIINHMYQDDSGRLKYMFNDNNKFKFFHIDLKTFYEAFKSKKIRSLD